MEIRRGLQSEFVETDSAKEAVLFSNTASFLLDRLRKDSAASYLAQKMDAAEIVDMLAERCKEPPTDPIDLLWVYVSLAALSLTDDLPKLTDKLNAIDLRHVQWGDEIRRAILQGLTPSNFVGVEYESLGKKSPTSVATSAATGIVAAEGPRR